MYLTYICYYAWTIGLLCGEVLKINFIAKPGYKFIISLKFWPTYIYVHFNVKYIPWPLKSIGHN